MLRTRFISCLVALGALMMFSGVARAQTQPSVNVTLSLLDHVLAIGQTTTATVSALIVNPEQDDGIFSFDTDVLLSDRGVFKIVAGSVNRVDVDPIFDTPNSDGVLVDGPGSQETLQSVHGTYSDTGHGVGVAQVLYTLQLIAVGEGSATIGVGPSVAYDGFDFLLYSTPTGFNATNELVPVNYPDPETIRVTPGQPGNPVPEPNVAMLGLAGLLAAGLYAGRRPARVLAKI